MARLPTSKTLQFSTPPQHRPENESCNCPCAHNSAGKSDPSRANSGRIRECGNGHALIHGFAVALGLLQQKIHAVDYRDPTGVTMQPLWPQIPPSQRIAIEREARRLAGYRQGREICDRLLRHLSDDPTGNRVNTWLRDADDPRLNSIVQQLFRVLRGLHD